MLAETLQAYDAASALWPAVRPLLEAALRLEHNDKTYAWHGWRKRDIEAFLQGLPERCSLVAGVWESLPPAEGEMLGEEILIIGFVCEVSAGEVQSIRTFDALTAAGLKPVALLEPGLPDALDIMRAAKQAVAPVAWALFTDRETWNAWVYGDGAEQETVDKGEALAALARQGRCVLLGSQAAHAHHHTS